MTENVDNLTQWQDQSEVFNGVSRSECADPRESTVDESGYVPAFGLGEELVRLGKADKRIVVMTADLGRSSTVNKFGDAFPERYFNTGIAEKNMITIAAGLASVGYLPYVATFASFASLIGAEQMRTDCAYTKMPVKIIGHHSGASLGLYGSSHHSLEDLGITRTIAGLTVLCAADDNELRAILRETLDWPEPIYIRLGRGRDPLVYDEPPHVEIGGSTTVREGFDATILATGSTVYNSVKAAEELAKEGLQVAVIDMYSISPFDQTAIIRAARNSKRILTVEEANMTNGLGTLAADTLFGLDLNDLRFAKIGIPNEYVPVGPPADIYANYKLDVAGIANTMKDLLR